MTYWNPVLRFGVERFAERLAGAGGAGLITPDLAPENADEWIAAADRYDLDRVFLAAPSSSDARIDRAVAASRGFVYTVSTMGTTGARTDVDDAARALADRIAARADATGTTALRCVGLGISTPEQVRDVLSYADGAIVGSALVRALGAGGVPAVRELAAVARRRYTRRRPGRRRGCTGSTDGGPIEPSPSRAQLQTAQLQTAQRRALPRDHPLPEHPQPQRQWAAAAHRGVARGHRRAAARAGFGVRCRPLRPRARPRHRGRAAAGMGAHRAAHEAGCGVDAARLARVRHRARVLPPQRRPHVGHPDLRAVHPRRHRRRDAPDRLAPSPARGRRWLRHRHRGLGGAARHRRRPRLPRRHPPGRLLRRRPRPDR